MPRHSDSDRPSCVGQATPARRDSTGQCCLRTVLLDLMMSRNALPWPGADSVTVEEVLGAYVLASRDRRVPDQEELIRRHPELTPEIRQFFTLAG